MSKKIIKVSKKKPKKKQNPNWQFNISYLLIAAFLFFAGFVIGEKKVREDQLATLEVQLQKDMQVVKGTRGDFNFKFTTKEYAALFGIKRVGFPHTAHEKLKNLSAETPLVIKIYQSRINDLSDTRETIPVYALSKKGKHYFNLQEYNQSRKMYHLRLQTIIFLAAILLALNGFNLLSSTQNKRLIWGIVIAILLMRIFRVIIY